MTSILHGITWEHPRGYDCMVAAARAYAEAGEVEISWDYRSLQAFADAPIEQLAHDFDLLVIDHPHVPKAAAEGLLAPLDGAGFDEELAALDQHSVGPSHASYRYQGHQYGLASDAAAQVSAYRPDQLSDPPRDWNSVLELAREGRVLWPAKPIDAYSSLLTLTANQGTPANALPGVFLAENDALQALDLMHELLSYLPESNLRLNPINVAELLVQDNDWVYCPLLFGYTNYSRAGFREQRLQYIDIPCGDAGPVGSLLGGAGVAVSAFSGQLDEARRFAFWVASAKVQSGVYFDGGGQPGHAQAWEDPRLNVQTLDFFRGTRATLESAYLRPRYPGYIEFQDTVAPLVTAALRGDITDVHLITRLNEQAEQLLTEDSYADR